MNDSVLVQSYVEAYDLSYPEALRRIESEVAELKHALEEEGRYILENLGELTVNQEGNYEFIPCESGILSPELYGLGSFSFKQLKDNTAREVAVAQPDAPNQAKTVALEEQHEELQLLGFTDNDDDADTAISIKMSWVRNAVAIAAAIIAFFFIATPVANSDLGTQTMSQLQHSILYKLIPQDTTLPAAETVVAETPAVDVADKILGKEEIKEEINEESKKEIKTEIQKEIPATTEPASASASPSSSITYCIIVASQVKQANAERYVEQLKKEGYPNAYVYISNHVVRVVSEEFSSEAEAYRVLNKMNMQEEFYEAWVYKKTNS